MPDTLSTNGLTLEQCARAEGINAYEVFAMQHSGYCFMGSRADLDAIKTKLENAACSTTPCLNGVGCLDRVSKAYWFTDRTCPILEMRANSK